MQHIGAIRQMDPKIRDQAEKWAAKWKCRLEKELTQQKVLAQQKEGA